MDSSYSPVVNVELTKTQKLPSRLAHTHTPESWCLRSLLSEPTTSVVTSGNRSITHGCASDSKCRLTDAIRESCDGKANALRTSCDTLSAAPCADTSATYRRRTCQAIAVASQVHQQCFFFLQKDTQRELDKKQNALGS